MIFVLLQRWFRRAVVTPKVSWRIGLLLFAVLSYGTTGFLYWELQHNPEMRWSDGLWYSLVTMTTVGYGDFFPKSDGGRYLVGFPLMLVGISVLGYALSAVAAAFVTAKNMETQGLSQLNCSEHLLLLNYPGLAKVERVLEELRSDPSIGPKTPVVLIDEDLTEIPPELATRGVRFVRGNPARDETLRRARASEATHAVILALHPGDIRSDHRNVAIALALESHHRGIVTVVECIDPSSEELLRKTGCDRIVCTARFEANFLSQELINPGTQDVVSELMSSLYGQNIYITPLPPVGRPASFGALAAQLARQSHLLIGLRRPSGILLNPPAETALADGDAAVSIGEHRLPTNATESGSRV